MTKKTVFYKEVSDEELGQLEFYEVFEDHAYSELEKDEHGFVKGKFRVGVTWCSEDDCDCTGFVHRSDCPHWVLPY